MKIKKLKYEKRGFLLAEETLKIILAVIAIGFLAYLLFSIYKSNKDSKELEFAKESVDFLIQALNSGQKEVELFNPKGWIVYSWPNKYTKGIILFKEEKTGIPKSCENLGWRSCICICKDANPESCDSDGICRENKNNFLINAPIEIKNPPINLLINQENKEILKKQ